MIVHKVVVTGAESTGKSTLARLLADHYRCPLVDERLRLYVEEQGSKPKFKDFRPIVELMCRAEERAIELARQTETPLVIMDTDALSLRVYWEYYFEEHPELDRYEMQPASLYLLMHDDILWVPDPGQRDGAEVRAETQPLFVAKLEAESKDYVPVRGEWEDRFEQATEAIDVLVGGPGGLAGFSGSDGLLG